MPRAKGNRYISVSVSRKAYTGLRDRSREILVPMSQIVDCLINEYIDQQEAKHALPSPR